MSRMDRYWMWLRANHCHWTAKEWWRHTQPVPGSHRRPVEDASYDWRRWWWTRCYQLSPLQRAEEKVLSLTCDPCIRHAPRRLLSLHLWRNCFHSYLCSQLAFFQSVLPTRGFRPADVRKFNKKDGGNVLSCLYKCLCNLGRLTTFPQWCW